MSKANRELAELLGWNYRTNGVGDVGGWYQGNDPRRLIDGFPDGRCFHYDTDLNAMREVEIELEKRGLGDAYCQAIDPVPINKGLWEGVGVPDCNPSRVGDWLLLTAPPRIRRDAAIRVLKDTEDLPK